MMEKIKVGPLAHQDANRNEVLEDHSDVLVVYQSLGVGDDAEAPAEVKICIGELRLIKTKLS